MNKNRILVFALSLLVFIILVYYLWSYTIDDAFITYRYAKHLVEGHGLTFNVGQEPVEAYSNFLWLLLLSLVYAIGLPIYLTTKILGVLFFIITGIVWFNYLGQSGKRFLWLAAPFFLANPVSAFWAVSGLEIGLYALIISGLLIYLIKRSWWSLPFVILIVPVRPEGFAIAAAAIAIAWVIDLKNSNKLYQYYIVNIAVLAAAMIAITILRISVFGYPFPNTVYVKSTLSHHGLFILIKGLLYFLPITLLFMLGIYKIISEKLSQRRFVVFAGIFLLQAIINCLADAVMNFNLRYMAAFLPLFFITALYGFDLIKNVTFRQLIIALSVVSLVAPIFEARSRMILERKILGAQNAIIGYINKQEGIPEISMTDMGRVPFYTKGYYHDLWGLASEDIAHHGFDVRREFLRFPDYFIFVGYIDNDKVKLRFGRERLIFSIPAFSHVYSLAGAGIPGGADLHSPGYYYLAFKKDPVKLDSLLEKNALR